MYSLKILRLGVSINEKKYILQELDIKERRRRTVDTVKETKTKTKHKTKKIERFIQGFQGVLFDFERENGFCKTKGGGFLYCKCAPMESFASAKKGQQRMT